jgi:hypothetical protein
MSRPMRLTLTLLMALFAAGTGILAQQGGAGGTTAAPNNGNRVPHPSAMNNPYRMLANWPHLGTIKPGAAIGIVPDGEGGVWLQHRSDPAILHINSAGDIVQKWAVTFSQSHGFCRDHDGNFWAVDSSPFSDTPGVTGVKGNQVFKYSPDGKLLLTLGKPDVSKAGSDTFVQVSSCTVTPEGNILFTDGHWPRPKVFQQDGDRLVWYTRDGKFIKAFGKLGTGLGEFMGPHATAFDSQGRLFVADRSNNRVQIFDKNMNFIDDWKQFGRPSGIWIKKDDTLIVSDSESSYDGFMPAETRPVHPDATTVRNAGHQNGIRVGSAKDGSLKYFIPDTRPEGLAADETGNIFGGLTGGCDMSPSGGCLQKYVPK